MRTHISSLVVALLVALGTACSGTSAQRGASDSTTTQSRKPDTGNPSPSEPHASGSRAENRGPLACPVKAALSVPHDQRDGTTRTLVPGHPIALLACRYHGFNQPQPIGTFASSTTELQVSQVAHELNATPRPTNGVAPNCPNNSGETSMLYFYFREGHPLLVRFDNGGCRYVTNGDLTLPFGPVGLTLRLEATLGQDHLELRGSA